jgi:hypothetical protein
MQLLLHEPCCELLCDEVVKRALAPIKCLDYIINISFNMEVEVMGLGDMFEILENFYLMFFILQKKCNT